MIDRVTSLLVTVLLVLLKSNEAFFPEVRCVCLANGEQLEASCSTKLRLSTQFDPLSEQLHNTLHHLVEVEPSLFHVL